MSNRSQGFTLIELLVVISIIGLLSSVVLVNLQETKIKSRDTQRISDMREIRNALELYYADHGYYPPSYACGWDCNGYSVSYSDVSWNDLQTHLSPYISKLPKDPINSNCAPWGDGCYSYTYGNVGRSTYSAQYDLTTQLENRGSQYRCGAKGYRFYFSNSYAWCGQYSQYLYEASL